MSSSTIWLQERLPAHTVELRNIRRVSALPAHNKRPVGASATSYHLLLPGTYDTSRTHIISDCRSRVSAALVAYTHPLHMFTRVRYFTCYLSYFRAFTAKYTESIHTQQAACWEVSASGLACRRASSPLSPRFDYRELAIILVLLLYPDTPAEFCSVLLMVDAFIAKCCRAFGFGFGGEIQEFPEIVTTTN